MRLQDKLISKILAITTLIDKEYSELHVHLNETPLFLSYNVKGISVVDFEHYLESLTFQ